MTAAPPAALLQSIGSAGEEMFKLADVGLVLAVASDGTIVEGRS